MRTRTKTKISPYEMERKKASLSFPLILSFLLYFFSLLIASLTKYNTAFSISILVTSEIEMPEKILLFDLPTIGGFFIQFANNHTAHSSKPINDLLVEVDYLNF
jgi:hypothetical protein